MNLYHYLVRLESILHSRQDIDVELLQVDVITAGVKFKSELHFYDGSRLSIAEQLEPIGTRDFNRITYKFHCQDKDGNLIFRYDNAPHIPLYPPDRPINTPAILLLRLNRPIWMKC